MGVTALAAGLLPAPTGSQPPPDLPAYGLLRPRAAHPDLDAIAAPRVLVRQEPSPLRPGLAEALARWDALDRDFALTSRPADTSVEVTAPAAPPAEAPPAPAAVEQAAAPAATPTTPQAVPASAAPAAAPAVDTAVATAPPVESVTAPPPPAPSVSLSAKEAGLLEAMNQQRAAAGLEPLVARQDLTTVARGRSADMVANDYFGHFHEGGTSAYSMLTSAGVGYGAAGENLAKVPGDSSTAVQLAIDALMASPTHRENILRGDYRFVGVGERVDANGITILTAIFTDR